MIQQHLTVEGLYLRKKHPELAAGQRPFYIWRKSKVKDQDALRCLAFINTESDQKPATVSQAFLFYGLTPQQSLYIHSPGHSSFSVFTSSSGCNCWLSPLPPFLSHIWSCEPTSRAQVSLPQSQKEDTVAGLFSEPQRQRQQALDRPQGWHESGPGPGDKIFLSSPPVYLKKNPTKETETHTQKKALVTPPVWGWHLILGTEESSKHYRGSEKEIWERFCKIYLLLPLLWVLLWNKGMVQRIQLSLQCSTMSSHKSLVSAAHFELKSVSPSRAVWLRTLFYLTQIQNPRTKLLA